MQASQFLEHLAEKGLLDDNVLGELREQVSGSDGITAEAITKLLVDNGHLTKFQATKLIGEFSPGGGDSGKAPAKQQVAMPASEEDLLLAPLSTENIPAPEEEDDEEVVNLEDASQPARKASPSAKKTSRSGKEAKSTKTANKPTTAKKTSGSSKNSDSSKKASRQQKKTSDKKKQWQGEPPADDPLGAALTPDPLGTPTDVMAATPTVTRPVNTLKPRRQKHSVWESKRFLGGVLLLGIFGVGGIWLFISLTTGDAKARFQEAEDLYLDGSFTAARAIYEDYLKKHKGGEDYSLARVRYWMAQLQAARNNPANALKVAQDVLPRIMDEESFGQARVELETILPDIADGFAKRAQDSKDPAEQRKFLALCDEAMELVNTGAYLPTSTINKSTVQTKLKDIAEKKDTAERSINQDATLRATIEEMKKLTAEGRTLDALESRKQLLLKYPGLDRHPDLVKATLATTAAEKALVKVSNEEIKPETTEQPQGKVEQTVPSTLTGKPIASARGQIGYANVAGRVYAVDVATGKLLWARFLGTESVYHPRRASDVVGADVIVSDVRSNEVLRLDAKTGKVKWRTNIGEPFAQPVVVQDRVLVSGQQNLVVLELESGQSNMQASFPLPLKVSATHDRLARMYYQLGERANIYALSEKTLECEEVYYFGHRPGSIEVPVVSAVGFLLVCQNVGTKSSLLHVLKTKDGIAPAMDPIQLNGNILVPPVLFGRKALIITDRGAIHVYDVDPNMGAPLTELAAVSASYSERTLAYPLVENSRLWLGEARFIKYFILTAKGELVRQFVEDRGQYLAPIELYGDVLFQVRRQRGGSGISVSAKSTDSEGADSDWELDLAVPTALTVDPTTNQVRAITARSGLFSVAAGNHVVTEKPQVSNRGETTFSQAVSLGNGTTVLSELRQQNQLLVYDPATDANKLQRIALQGASGEAATQPVAFQDALLIPFRNGRIGLFDWKTGKEKALPFFPPLGGGQQVGWSRPVVVDDAFIVCDDQNVLRRIGIQAEPRPHLAMQTKVQLERPLHGKLAKSGDVILAVFRGTSKDTVQAIAPADLKLGDKVELTGRVIWGPEAVGDVVFFATPTKLHCFQGAKSQWETPLPYGVLAGIPVKDGDDYILASTLGTVWRVAGSDGKESNKVELGFPVSGEVLVHDGRIWLPSYDGTVLIVPMINPS